MRPTNPDVQAPKGGERGSQNVRIFHGVASAARKAMNTHPSVPGTCKIQGFVSAARKALGVPAR